MLTREEEGGILRRLSARADGPGKQLRKKLKKGLTSEREPGNIYRLSQKGTDAASGKDEKSLKKLEKSS